MLASPGTCWKFKTLGPTPDLLNGSVPEPNNSDPRVVYAGVFNLRILWCSKQSFGSSCCFFPEKAMAAHSSTLAWQIPWTEEPGGLRSMAQRVGHD